MLKENKFYQEFFLNRINHTWNDFFFVKFGPEKLEILLEKLNEEWKVFICYPKKENIFRLFYELSLDQIKVVILGQDPYHQQEIADGFAFSTSKKNFIPASLRNILTEMKSDLGHNKQINNGDLTSWVKQGVFLLNTALTVRHSEQLSHAIIWKNFIYQLLKYINNYNKKIVWVFWGREARLLKDKCDIASDFSIISVHPSPFSAHYGFFGSKPFSNINKKLEEIGTTEIKWTFD